MPDDTVALQKALDGQGLIEIPAGLHKIFKTLLVGSNTHIRAAKDAIIKLADGAVEDERSFILCNRNMGNGDVGIVVEGGVWDYNNERNSRGRDGDPHGCTGAALNFVNVRGLELRKVTVRNPDAYSVRLGEVSDFIVEDIGLDHPAMRLNQDGIHLGGFVERGVIRRIKALTPKAPNDDMVALNADDNVERVINLGMRRGPIRDIEIDGLEAEEAYTFVRLLSVDKPIERISIANVRGACRVNALNMNSWAFPQGVGNIRDVKLSNWNVWSNRREARGCLCDIALSVENLVFENLNVSEGSLDADTFVLRNDSPWHVRFEGLSSSQRMALLSSSVNVKDVSGDDGALEFEGVSGSRVVLPSGGIEGMKLRLRSRE